MNAILLYHIDIIANKLYLVIETLLISYHRSFYKFIAGGYYPNFLPIAPSNTMNI